MTARTEHSGDFKIREQVQGESGGDEWGWLFFFSSFIEIFSYHTIHPFKVCYIQSSASAITIIEHFHSLKKKCPFLTISGQLSPPQS